MKIANKTINYSLRAEDATGKLQLIDNSADLQLPSIEKMTDTIKGAGIMGEIDMPVPGQIGSMTTAINYRADNGQYSMLSRPGAIKVEVAWVTDVLDSSSIKIGFQSNKMYMTVVNKKIELGKIEVNGSLDGSCEFEVLYLKKIIDGKEVLLIDKLNFIYAVNGKDYMEQFRAALK